MKMYTHVYIYIYRISQNDGHQKDASNAWRAEWFWVSFRNRNGQKVPSPEYEHYVFDVSFTMNKCRKWKTCHANSLPFCPLGFSWFLSPLFSFFLGLKYDEPGSNSSLQGSPKRISSWQVLNLSGLHDAWRSSHLCNPELAAQLHGFPAGWLLLDLPSVTNRERRGFGSVQFLEHTLTEIADCCNPNDLAELYGEWLAILNWLNFLRCNCQFCSSGSCLWGSNCLNVLSLIWLDARQWGSLCGVNETGPRHLSSGCLKTQTPKYQETFVVGSQIHGFFFLLFWHLTGSILPPPTECDLIGGFVLLHTAGRERKRAAN